MIYINYMSFVNIQGWEIQIIKMKILRECKRTNF